MTRPAYVAHEDGEQCTWSADGRETDTHVGARCATCGAPRLIRRPTTGGDVAAVVAAVNAGKGG